MEKESILFETYKIEQWQGFYIIFSLMSNSVTYYETNKKNPIQVHLFLKVPSSIINCTLTSYWIYFHIKDNFYSKIGTYKIFVNSFKLSQQLWQITV